MKHKTKALTLSWDRSQGVSERRLQPCEQFTRRLLLTLRDGSVRERLQLLKSWSQLLQEFDESRIFPKFVEVWISFEPGKVWVTIFGRIIQPLHRQIGFIHQGIGR